MDLNWARAQAAAVGVAWRGRIGGPIWRGGQWVIRGPARPNQTRPYLCQQGQLGAVEFDAHALLPALAPFGAADDLAMLLKQLFCSQATTGALHAQGTAEAETLKHPTPWEPPTLGAAARAARWGAWVRGTARLPLQSFGASFAS